MKKKNHKLSCPLLRYGLYPPPPPPRNGGINVYTCFLIKKRNSNNNMYNSPSKIFWDQLFWHIPLMSYSKYLPRPQYLSGSPFHIRNQGHSQEKLGGEGGVY